MLRNSVSPSVEWTLTLSIIMAVTNQLIGLVGRVFANSLGDLATIPSRVIPKTLKMVLDTSLLNTQQYKVHIKRKVEQSRERSSALPLHLSVVAIEKGAFWSPSTTVANNFMAVTVSLGDYMLVVFASSSFFVWNQMFWRNIWTIVWAQYFLHLLL